MCLVVCYPPPRDCDAPNRILTWRRVPTLHTSKHPTFPSISFKRLGATLQTLSQPSSARKSDIFGLLAVVSPHPYGLWRTKTHTAMEGCSSPIRPCVPLFNTISIKWVGDTSFTLSQSLWIKLVPVLLFAAPPSKGMWHIETHTDMEGCTHLTRPSTRHFHNPVQGENRTFWDCFLLFHHIHRDCDTPRHILPRRGVPALHDPASRSLIAPRLNELGTLLSTFTIGVGQIRPCLVICYPTFQRNVTCRNAYMEGCTHLTRPSIPHFPSISFKRMWETLQTLSEPSSGRK